MHFTRPSGRARRRCANVATPVLPEALECRALLSAASVAATADVVPAALAVQADGKLVAVGTTNQNGTNDFVVARYNADGTVDSSFGNGGRVLTDFDSGDDQARDVEIQGDGRILVGGQGSYENGAGGGYTYAVARYNPDGSLDPTFDGDGKARRPGLAANGMALAPDGKIVLAGGNYAYLDFSTQIVAMRLNADGSPDTTFGSQGRAVVMMGTWGAIANDVDVRDDGKVIFGGDGIIPPPPFGHGIPPAYISVVGRLNADGSMDDTRVVSELHSIRQVAAAPDDKVLYTGLNSNDDVVVREVGSDLSTAGSTFGSLGNYTFAMLGTGIPRALERQPDGKIVVAMLDVLPGGDQRTLVGRLTPGGTPDLAFGTTGGVATLPTGNSFHDLADAVVQPSGRIVALGTGLFAAHKDFALAALTPAGGSDDTFRFGDPTSARLAQVWVGSTEWSPAFRQSLASATPDDSAAYGRALLGGRPGQGSPLPWVNLNQVALHFDRPTVVGRDDLSARGVNVPQYAVADFHYDPADNTAVWTFAAPIGADKVEFELERRRFSEQPVRMSVLPGDVDGNGAVVAADASAVKRSFFRTTANPGAGDDAYSPFRDVDGSGAILASDFSNVKQRFFTRLPEDDATVAALATAPERKDSPSVTTDVLTAV